MGRPPVDAVLLYNLWRLCSPWCVGVEATVERHKRPEDDVIIVKPLTWLATTEQRGLRSPTQAGYRPGHSTVHQTFVLQHVIDKHRRLKSPLYLCFVDLKSAYDRVQWQLLWDLLRQLGVQGTMLGAIQSMYDGCLLSMRVNGVTGGSQNPLHGVAAGVPPQRHPVWPLH